jgi:hypothetical protein
MYGKEIIAAAQSLRETLVARIRVSHLEKVRLHSLPKGIALWRFSLRSAAFLLRRPANRYVTMEKKSPTMTARYLLRVCNGNLCVLPRGAAHVVGSTLRASVGPRCASSVNPASMNPEISPQGASPVALPPAHRLAHARVALRMKHSSQSSCVPPTAPGS